VGGIVLLGGAALGAWLVASGGGTVRSRGRPVASTASNRAPTSSSPSTAPASPTTAGPPPPPVTFAFAGDIHFEGALGAKLQADPTHLLAPVAPVLSSVDLAVVNLETAITTRGTKVPKLFNFRAPPPALVALAAAGIKTASLANNHGLDYGPVGLQDTLAAEQATGFPLIGVGANAAQAYAPYRATIKGERVAVLAATQVIDDPLITSWTATDTQPGLASAKNVPRLVAAVRAARADADLVVVFLHWGLEGTACPTVDQQQLAHQLAAAGADIIVGSHTHRVEGAGRLGTAFVDYGLGNFVFYNEEGASGQSGILMVTAAHHHVIGYGWIPAAIRGGVPQPLTGSPAADAIARFSAQRGCTGLTP
jgi:poly-gamma-glutamate synthesis protein (capsule biosynthesis protein)